MSEQFPDLIYPIKASKRTQAMCRDYWAFTTSPTYGNTCFTYKIEELATKYKCAAAAVEPAVKKACSAQIPCHLCHNPIPAADRKTLVLLRALGEQALHCDKCTIYLRTHHEALFTLEQQKTYVRPVINVTHEKQQLFIKLSGLFPRVFPNLSPATFIHKNSPSIPKEGDGWFDYFLKTRVSFTICNAKNEPVAVIDWPEIQGEYSKETMMNFKRRLMLKSGIRYFVFPQDRHLFEKELLVLQLRCLLSVLPYSLEEILAKTQKKELLLYQQLGQEEGN